MGSCILLYGNKVYMENKRVLKICSFLSFLFSYVWGVIFLINQENSKDLVVLSLICGISLILFLLSHLVQLSLPYKRKDF